MWLFFLLVRCPESIASPPPALFWSQIQMCLTGSNEQQHSEPSDFKMETKQLPSYRKHLKHEKCLRCEGEQNVRRRFLMKRKIKFSCIIAAGLASQRWGITIRQYVGQPQRGMGGGQPLKPACHRPNQSVAVPPTPPFRTDSLFSHMTSKNCL